MFHSVCTSCTKLLYFACNVASKEFIDYNATSTMKCNLVLDSSFEEGIVNG
jgi:hypothetical protein